MRKLIFREQGSLGAGDFLLRKVKKRICPRSNGIYSTALDSKGGEEDVKASVKP